MSEAIETIGRVLEIAVLCLSRQGWSVVKLCYRLKLGFVTMVQMLMRVAVRLDGRRR